MKHCLYLLALLAISCGTAPEGQYPAVKSYVVNYNPGDPETYTFKYDAQGRIVQIENNWDSSYDGKHHAHSWKYAYKENSAQIKEKIWGRDVDSQADFQGDFQHAVYVHEGESYDEELETYYLGSNLNFTYQDGLMVKSLLYDLTSDGTDSTEYTWSPDGNIVKIDSSDPSVGLSITNIVYSPTDNPFTGVDPTALMFPSEPYFRFGMAGPRPSKLIWSYTQTVEDWCEDDVLTQQVKIEYETNADGLISRIDKVVDGEVRLSVSITY